MHTLSILPQLFFLAPFGYVLIRGALAALLFIAAKEQWSEKATPLLRLLIGAETLIGIALALGYMAQIAAVAAAVIFVLWIVLPWARPYPLSTILLGIVMAIVILISGAGLLAVDLPL